MAEHSLWRFSRALHSAINGPEDRESQIDDDVDWVIHGPIELFPFLGARRGKAAVLKVCRQISENVRVRRFHRESIALGEDTAASTPMPSLMKFRQSSLDCAPMIQIKAL
jgi:hypothetical protein